MGTSPQQRNKTYADLAVAPRRVQCPPPPKKRTFRTLGLKGTTHQRLSRHTSRRQFRAANIRGWCSLGPPDPYLLLLYLFIAVPPDQCSCFYGCCAIPTATSLLGVLPSKCTTTRTVVLPHPANIDNSCRYAVCLILAATSR